MPAFSHQFDEIDPFEPAIRHSFRDWAVRTARAAATMLQGRTREQLTCWGRAIEREIQQLAAQRVGEPSPYAAEPGQAMTSPAQVRWELTDLQLLGEVDVATLGTKLSLPDPWTGSARPVRFWQLRAVLALWKLVDASSLLDAEAARESARPISAADAYAGLVPLGKVSRKMAAEVASSLITEAAVAISLAWDAYGADLRESQSEWEKLLAEQSGAERGEAEQKRREGEKRSASARQAAYASKAETYRAQALVFAWLREKPDGHFASPSRAATRAAEYLNKERKTLGLEKEEWGEKAIREWLTDKAPKDLHSRWKRYSPRSKARKTAVESRNGGPDR